ncbi:unnamed protein product [Symbiodinium microadriaticum]|nr:unnamed protein product [Symbiodinium microadriaticum]
MVKTQHAKLMKMRSTIKDKEKELDDMEEDRSPTFSSGSALFAHSGNESDSDEPEKKEAPALASPTKPKSSGTGPPPKAATVKSAPPAPPRPLANAMDEENPKPKPKAGMLRATKGHRKPSCEWALWKKRTHNMLPYTKTWLTSLSERRKQIMKDSYWENHASDFVDVPDNDSDPGLGCKQIMKDSYWEKHACDFVDVLDNDSDPGLGRKQILKDSYWENRASDFVDVPDNVYTKSLCRFAFMASANFDFVTLVFDPMGFADISPASLAFGRAVILHWSKFKFFQRLWKFYQTDVTPRGRSASVAIAGLYDALGPTAKGVGVAYEPDESVHLRGLDDASEWCIWARQETYLLDELTDSADNIGCDRLILSNCCLNSSKNIVLDEPSRYTIVRDTKPDLTTPGRYILGNKGHFQGLVVHSDGTVILTTNHRTADNIIITPQRLLDTQMEAVFRLVPRGCGERLTERSGGSHLSAGAASACGSCDARGGGSCLLPELLSFLPSYYSCLKHLSTLAACSRSMKEQVLNKHHWKDCHLDLEVSDLLHDQQAMRVLSRWWENARTINLSQHQLPQLSGIPRNCLLRWRVFDLPCPDQQSTGYRAVHSLLGCARFQLHIPDHVRTLKIGVENPRGPEAVWINIHELFTERMCFNFGLVPSQRRLASRSVSLHGGILRPRSPNYVMLMWARHYFTIQLNGHNLGPVQLNVDTAPGPPSQGLPFLWAVSAKRAQRRSTHIVFIKSCDAWCRMHVPPMSTIPHFGNS